MYVNVWTWSVLSPWSDSLENLTIRRDPLVRFFLPPTSSSGLPSCIVASGILLFLNENFATWPLAKTGKLALFPLLLFFSQTVDSGVCETFPRKGRKGGGREGERDRTSPDCGLLPASPTAIISLPPGWRPQAENESTPPHLPHSH